MRQVVLVVLAAVLLSACGGDPGSQRAPVNASDGVQLTGQFGGSRLNVDDGEPEVLLGDCDAGDGADGDFCIVTRSIGGSPVTLTVENPQVLLRGGDLAVNSRGCQGFACEEEARGLVVDLRVDGTTRRASSGTITVTRADTRYAGTLNLRFPDGGALSGEFDVALPPR